LDTDAYERALAACRPDPGDSLSLDSKTLRGSANSKVASVHLLAAYAP
jgi:hypothetical protein